MAFTTQPIPQFASPFLGNEEALRELGLRFNPIWLRWFLDLTKDIGRTVEHNALVGIQGGSVGEYYHLSQATYNGLNASRTANTFYAGPIGGAAALPTFRAVDAADIPNGIISYAKIQSVSANTLLGRTGLAGVVEEIPCTSAARSRLAESGGLSGTWNVDGAAAGTVATITISNGLITGITVR